MDLIYGHDMRELGYLKILDLFETHRRNETFRRGWINYVMKLLGKFSQECLNSLFVIQLEIF